MLSSLLKCITSIVVPGPANSLRGHQKILLNSSLSLSFGDWTQLPIAHYFADLLVLHSVILLSLLELRGGQRLINMPPLIFQEALIYQQILEIPLKVPQRLIREVISL